VDRSVATSIFETLSSGHRLDAFRLLVRKGTEGLVAGEIGVALGMPPSNLSFHLRALSQSGLVTVAQEGRYQRYRANLPLMVELVGYLTEECCGGRPEQCEGLNPNLICAEAAGRQASCGPAAKASCVESDLGAAPRIAGGARS